MEETGATMEQWITVAIQAGGAIAVCGMFLWFLTRKQAADDEARKHFMQHLTGKDEMQTAYLQQRDAQSKEIASAGHEALRTIATEVAELRANLGNHCKGS